MYHCEMKFKLQKFTLLLTGCQFRTAVMLLCLPQRAAPLCSYSVTIRFYLFWLNTP
ncbi:uncharacterized LOC128031836 homolog [Mirounga angustirostris]|uniref:uncharacterized LOC128031836 homolog n=1 Tax=Mirounga angustirostris TaxID=9716 RepID=UPI00313A873D